MKMDQNGHRIPHKLKYISSRKSPSNKNSARHKVAPHNKFPTWPFATVRKYLFYLLFIQ
jgi:hypothetical protein